MTGLRMMWCFVLLFYPLSVKGVFTGPSNEVVVEGQTATLTCRAGAGVTIGFSSWLDDGANIATKDGVFNPAPKYSNFAILNADTVNGQMDLQIANAQYEDEGTYECQINADISDPATLTVEAQVTSVTITVNGASGSPVDVVAGEEQTLVCTAFGARPRVGIDWTNDGTSLSGDTETESVNGNTTDTISTLLYTPTSNDNGRQFRCETTGQEAATPQSQSVTLNVQFAPVDVTVEYSQGTITCSSTANPTVANNMYVITLNDTETSIGKTLKYDPEMYGCTTVKCTATNTIGTASGSLADPLCPGATTMSPTTTSKPTTTKKGGTAPQTNPAVIALAVIIPIAVLVAIICIVLCYKQKKFCFAPSKTGSGGTIPKKQPSASNADMIRNQPEVRQSVHKYDDEPKKPRIPRSSTGNSKKQPGNDAAPRQSGGSPVEGNRGYPAEYPDGRNQDGGGESGVNYADLEFQNRQGDTNGHGQIHYPEEEPTQYASILV
ncbi:kin of IRRE-like protein 2 isoform X2 [Asterias rubens]|uniref:kin of IRRE-like protein 2 isoform X2 n=1 Tax=Asterias rubens TaxID=7604 RepID=UPI001454FF05|nr:kin of IRRE-like protein 2 isoform X2 [Asterias rubens]